MTLQTMPRVYVAGPYRADDGEQFSCHVHTASQVGFEIACCGAVPENSKGAKAEREAFSGPIFEAWWNDVDECWDISAELPRIPGRPLAPVALRPWVTHWTQAGREIQ